MKYDQIILKKVYVCSNKCNKLSQNYPIIDVIAKIVAGVYKLCVIVVEPTKIATKKLKNDKRKYRLYFYKHPFNCGYNYFFKDFMEVCF